VVEYLSALAKRELTGIARARKMSAIWEYFRFLEGVGVISKSPTTGIETPKREKNSRQYLRSDEYTKMGIVSKPVQKLVGRLTLFQSISQVLSHRKTT
jgi:site-specific recombinase XerD